MPADLADTTVLLDFDGTITTVDTGVHLLARLADERWHEPEAEYKAGRIGSRECLLRQWETLTTTDEDVLRATAREVPVDPAFPGLVEGLRAAGAEVLVVSDGYGFYAEEVCAPLAVAVVTNRVDFATGTVEFPHADPSCACASCGTCKEAPVREARRRGRTTVLVGDGVSDRKAALVADRVIAKGELAAWCADNAVAHTEFSTLADVRRTLLGR